MRHFAVNLIPLIPLSPRGTDSPDVREVKRFLIRQERYAQALQLAQYAASLPEPLPPELSSLRSAARDAESAAWADLMYVWDSARYACAGLLVATIRELEQQYGGTIPHDWLAGRTI
jgi:hypothetical protein